MISNRKLAYDRLIHSIPGRYVCRLEFELDGKAYKNHIEVYNPVYGFAQLEEWEGLILKRRESRRKAA